MWRLSQVLLLLLSFSLGQTDPLGSQIGCPNEARPHSRPYMAALMNSKKYYICGGFLVGRQWVMTSARCKNVSEVVLGAYNVKYDGESHTVAHRYRHQGYRVNNNTFSNDILLLKLSSKVRLSRNIGILPLPPPNSDLSDGTPCSVAGWGLKQRLCPSRLHEAHINIYNRSKCQKFYPKIDYGKLCAGERENCQAFAEGEKGDPLVCNGEARGILSYTNPCPPAVYTDIAQYLPWIKKTMAK